MRNTTEQIEYFMGANTPFEFISKFDDLYDPINGFKVYILKGGPGTGKSGLMKAIASHFEEDGKCVHRIFCSSDPSSLDAVLVEDKKICILDGTAPHVWVRMHRKRQCVYEHRLGERS